MNFPFPSSIQVRNGNEILDTSIPSDGTDAKRIKTNGKPGNVSLQGHNATEKKANSKRPHGPVTILNILNRFVVS